MEMINSQVITGAYAADVPVRGERSLTLMGAISAAAFYTSCYVILSFD